MSYYFRSLAFVVCSISLLAIIAIADIAAFAFPLSPEHFSKHSPENFSEHFSEHFAENNLSEAGAEARVQVRER